MPLAIQNYLPPGAYSQIIANATSATTIGPPVVCIIGQAVRGPYGPYLYTNSSDLQTTYGPATQGNPLSLGAKFAFLNGALNVLACNVPPDNSTPAYFSMPLTSFPISAYTPAPSTAVDAVTQQQVNSLGNVAGSFYIQDFNPSVPDPVYNTSTTATAQAFALLSNSSTMYQYLQLAGYSFVPLQNSPQAQVVIYSYNTTTPPLSSINQGQWNQYNNAFQIFSGVNTAFQSPVQAQILIPDTSTVTNGPIAGYSNLFNSIGNTVNTGSAATSAVLTNLNVGIQYAMQHGGVLWIGDLNNGTQHGVFMGLFDSNTASTTSTESQAFGMPGFINGSANNPYFYTHNGTDGAVTSNSFNNALALVDNQRADLIVMMNPNPALQSSLEVDVATQSNFYYRNERVGLTSGYTYDSYQTTITNVTALQGGPGAQRMIYIYPTSAYYNDLIQNRVVVLDGTYIAAACAGALAANDAAEPLTHKTLAGFTDIGLHLTNTAANGIAQYGVTVIENNPQFGIRVRHGLTCNPTNVNTQEISVVRQLDYVAQSLRAVMDANIVATKITKNTLGAVTSLATTTLSNLLLSNIIANYQAPVARIDPSNPTRINLYVTLTPAYPCNYVDIFINIDTTPLSSNSPNP